MVRFLVHSNLLVAAAAAALCYETMLLLHMPADTILLLFVFFSTLFTYNLHRLAAYRTGSSGDIITARYIWVNEHRNVTSLMLALGLLGSLALFFYLPANTWRYLVPAALISLAYNVPGTKGVGLRFIALIKLLLIVVTWVLVTVMLPVSAHGKWLPVADVLFIAAERTCFIFAITVPFDIRDLRLDKKYGLTTLPVVTGEQWAKRIASLAVVAFIGLVWFHEVYSGLYSMYTLLALVASAIIAGVLILTSGGRKGELHYTGWLDATMIIQCLLVYLAMWL